MSDVSDLILTSARCMLVLGLLVFGAACGEGVLEQSEEVDEDEVEVVGELRRCAQGPTVKGIDVSYYQDRPDWDRVAAGGFAFGIARISDGTRYIDNQFARNWSEMRRVGMIRGSYQFFRPAQSPERQAQIVIDAVGELGPGDLPVVLDVETSDGVADATIMARMQTWLDLVEAGTGKRPIIYAASGFWNTLRGTSRFAAYDLWVANYYVSCPAMPNTWEDWTMWQYTDRGSVPGIRGGVDTNHFNGTYEDLVRYANGGASSEPELDPIEVYWARLPDGSYNLRALAAQDVARVEYRVDTYLIAGASRADGFNFPDNYTFSVEARERHVEVLGFDENDEPIARGVGLMDVTSEYGVYIKQMGEGLYEVGLERAPQGVAFVEVTVDDRWVLTDSVSGEQRSSRGAVRHTFSESGERRFKISTYNADGSLRGNLYRTFEIE